MFYKNIGFSDRAIEIEEWNAEDVFNKAVEFIKNGKYEPSSDYLMSLYEYLFDICCDLFNVNNCKIYSFEQVASNLESVDVPESEDGFDCKLKLLKAEKLYLSRFTEIKNLEKEIENLKNSISNREKEFKTKLKEKDGIIAKQKQKLDRINKKFVVRAWRKLHRIFKRK